MRHRSRGEPAVADRGEDVRLLLLADVETRAVLVLPVVRLDRRALRPDHVERVAPGAVRVEDLCAAVGGAARGDRDAPRAARAGCPPGPPGGGAPAAPGASGARRGLRARLGRTAASIRNNPAVTGLHIVLG